MNKMFKRIISIVLSVIMTVSVFTVGSSAKDKTKDNVVFSAYISFENEDTVEITLSIISGSISFFDLETVSPCEYSLESIEKSDALKEEIVDEKVIMACNEQTGRISFASSDCYTRMGDFCSFIYKKTTETSVDVSVFKFYFSSLGRENFESATAIVFYDGGEELSVNVSPNSLELKYKDYDMVTVGVAGDTDCDVSFTSSNPKVVKVDENGNIYAAKRGTATITCTVTDSDGYSVSDTCTVKVKYTFGQWLIKILLFGWIWY